jgi:hypothetical protein
MSLLLPVSSKNEGNLEQLDRSCGPSHGQSGETVIVWNGVVRMDLVDNFCGLDNELMPFVLMEVERVG